MNWTQDRLQQLANTCWGEVTHFLKPDSCVLATRVFVDALRMLGERKTDALVVDVIVMSRAAAEHSQEHGCDRRIGSCPERGDRPLAVLGWNPDAPARGLMESWSGHVVAIVQRRWVVDLSLPQIHRPDLGLVVDEPLVFEVPPIFFKGTHGADLHEADHGMRLLYHALPNAGTDWQSSPDWSMQSRLRSELTRGTLRRYSGREPRYSPELQMIFALTGKV